MISNTESENHLEKEKAKSFCFVHALFEYRILDLIVFCLKNRF